MTHRERQLRAFRRNRTAMVGLGIVVFMMVVALSADMVAGFDPRMRIDPDRLDIFKLAPSGEHPLGTDDKGFDVFSRLLFGARTSLITAFAAITLALLVGVPLGAVAGWRGGWVEALIMRGVDVALAFPSILIAVSIAAIRGERALVTVIYAVAAVAIAPIVRQVRASVLQVKALDYVTAAIATGLSPKRVLFGTVLPNCLAPIIVLASLGTGVAILDAAGLSFLGLGPPADAPEWGVMLQDSFKYARDADLWYLLIPPGAAIALTVLGFNLLGDGVRDALDPRTAMES